MYTRVYVFMHTRSFAHLYVRMNTDVDLDFNTDMDISLYRHVSRVSGVYLNAPPGVSEFGALGPQ